MKTLRASPAVALALAFAGALAACGTDLDEDATAEGEEALVASVYRTLPTGVTRDVGTLPQIIERDAIEGACDRHFARLDPRTEKFAASALRTPSDVSAAKRDLVLCGKSLFFTLPVPSDVAVPENLVRALVGVFPNETGPAMTKLGFRENPDEPGMPLELPIIPTTRSGPVALVTGKMRTLTCVACHVGRLPDGRLSVGMPNEDLDLAKFSLLTQYPLWLAGTSGERVDPRTWSPESQRYFQGLREASKGVFTPSRVMLDLADTMGWMGGGGVIRDLSGQDPVPLSDQRSFFRARRGQLNPASPMLSEPRVDVYESAPPIWAMAHHEGSPIGEPYLGRITSARSLEEFVRQAYVYTTLRTEYSTPKWVDPIAAYLRVLEVPRPPRADSPSSVAAGSALFARDCARCHDGLRGATSKAHPLDEVGSPLAFDALFSDYVPPTRQSAKTLAGLRAVGMLPLERTGIKSRRFDGLWARSRLGYSGALDGLDHLLCLGGRARANLDRSDPTADSTHAELCTAYSERERAELKSYLLQF